MSNNYLEYNENENKCSKICFKIKNINNYNCKYNPCHIFSLLIALGTLIFICISIISFTTQENIYSPYNITVYSRYPPYVSWNTKNKIDCILKCYYDDLSFIEIPDIHYNKIYYYVSYIKEITFESQYEAIVRCSKNNLIFKSNYFKFSLTS